MPTAANESEFLGAAQEKNRRHALGLQHSGPPSGGMTWADIVDLLPGTMLCRLGHMGTPIQISLLSAWWIRQCEFSALVRGVAANPTALTERAREGLALSDEYVRPDPVINKIRASCNLGDLDTLKNNAARRPFDRIHIVEVTRLLRAFSGPGRDVESNAPADNSGGGRVWRADPRIRQLYIPGLGADYRTADYPMTETARSSLHFRRSMPVRHWVVWLDTSPANRA